MNAEAKRTQITWGDVWVTEVEGDPERVELSVPRGRAGRRVLEVRRDDARDLVEALHRFLKETAR